MLPGNEEMYYLLSRAARQFDRAGMTGLPCSLKYEVVQQMARDLGIRRDRLFYEKLRIWEDEALRVIHAKTGSAGHETDEEYLESMKRAQGKLNGCAK